VEILIVCLTAFAVSLLTFFSGFGLGTILAPVLMLFFPVDLSIAITAVVHFLNNLFKAALTGRKANMEVLVKFGVPAILAAVAGAWLLVHISDSQPLFTYSLFQHHLAVYPVKLIIAFLLVMFALMELIPRLRNISFHRDYLFAGGMLSGFFGGLTGNQGALRSAFLVRAGLEKTAYIATAAVLSLFVDISRLAVYATRMKLVEPVGLLLPVTCATVAAFAGTYLGSRLLQKVTYSFIQHTVALLLMLIAGGLAAGIL
jgi:uncharacterized membrane protein YfcA